MRRGIIWAMGFGLWVCEGGGVELGIQGDALEGEGVELGDFREMHCVGTV